MSVLEMRRVSRTYGQGAAEVHALRDIDLSVDAGTMVAVMGPSGSGKSTLLTIAGSLEEQSTGEVRVCGQELSTLSRNAKARLRRRSIGYVFQDFNLLPGLTATENVTLPLELDGVPARKARVAGLEALEELGLADRAASCASWVTTTAATPRWHASCSSRITSSAFTESRAPDGSSASSRRRSPTTARAMATRCRSPPDS